MPEWREASAVNDSELGVMTLIWDEYVLPLLGTATDGESLFSGASRILSFIHFYVMWVPPASVMTPLLHTHPFGVTHTPQPPIHPPPDAITPILHTHPDRHIPNFLVNFLVLGCTSKLPSFRVH